MVESDVKIGCLTSGGIDSGLLTALIQKTIKILPILQAIQMIKIKMKEYLQKNCQKSK